MNESSATNARVQKRADDPAADRQATLKSTLPVTGNSRNASCCSCTLMLFGDAVLTRLPVALRPNLATLMANEAGGYVQNSPPRAR